MRIFGPHRDNQFNLHPREGQPFSCFRRIHNLPPRQRQTSKAGFLTIPCLSPPPWLQHWRVYFSIILTPPPKGSSASRPSRNILGQSSLHPRTPAFILSLVFTISLPLCQLAIYLVRCFINFLQHFSCFNWEIIQSVSSATLLQTEILTINFHKQLSSASEPNIFFSSDKLLTSKAGDPFKENCILVYIKQYFKRKRNPKTIPYKNKLKNQLVMQNLQIVRKLHLFIIRMMKRNFLDCDICRHRVLVQGNVRFFKCSPDNKTSSDVKPLFLKVTILWFLPKRSFSHCSGIYYDPTSPCLQKSH